MDDLRDGTAGTIKEPAFDRPEYMDPVGPAIARGTRVVLGYRGLLLTAQVEAVERLGTAFVGRIVRFTPRAARPIDLAPNDFIRFRHRDVLGTE